MTTIHAYTATQKTVDGPSGKVGGALFAEGALSKENSHFLTYFVDCYVCTYV